MKTIALSDFELNLLHGLLADEEIDIEAETKEEAEDKAKEYWDEKFRTMFGGVEFIKEVEEWQ